MRPEITDGDARTCEAILRQGSKSFATAARLLPRGVRERATVLYAFCRIADDLVDEGGAADEAIAELHARLDRAYAEEPRPDPIERAFSALVVGEKIPRVLFEALIEGFAWDVRGRTYASIEDVHAYGARVAGTIGAMMTLVMGERRPEALARACDLGVAMQLTNIARDVGEDAANGRLYLPTTWMTRAGIDVDAWRAKPTYDDKIAHVIAEVLREAERLYVRADAGIPMLPPECRIAIRAARLIYAEIGAAIAAASFDSITRRAVVPRRTKLWLLARAVPARFRTPVPFEAPPLEATRYLVAACAEAT